MKYLKLFEQDDEWWDEESPFDNLIPEEIKVGDWVVCVDDSRSEGELIFGEKYQIIDIIELNNTLLGLDGLKHRWFAERFEKTQPPKINEEYKLFKADYRKKWDLTGNNKANRNVKDPKEPFFIGKDKKDYKFEKELKEYLDTNFAPYLTYDKYLICKKKLEEAGYETEIDKGDFYKSFSFDRNNMCRWTVNENTRIYFIKYPTQIMIHYGSDTYTWKEKAFPIGRLDLAIKFLVDLKIPEEELRKKKEALRAKYKDIDPFDEENWEKEEDQHFLQF